MPLRYLTSSEQAVIADALCKHESHLTGLLKEKHPQAKAIENTIGIARVLRSYAQDRKAQFSITTP